MANQVLKNKTIKENNIKEISSTEEELLKTTGDLNKTIKELIKILKVLERHEYLTIHKNKWRLIGHNILLGMLFAVGTVFGLVLLSWLTFNFFKDSSMLTQIIQNQLKMRQLDIGDIREKAQQSINKSPENEVAPETSSGGEIKDTP